MNQRLRNILVLNRGIKKNKSRKKGRKEWAIGGTKIEKKEGKQEGRKEKRRKEGERRKRGKEAHTCIMEEHWRKPHYKTNKQTLIL